MNSETKRRSGKDILNARRKAGRKERQTGETRKKRQKERKKGKKEIDKDSEGKGRKKGAEKGDDSKRNYMSGSKRESAW